ncbi:hypothetical protein H6G97_51465 [Nostoc flagelliforme FACHB-838]|uniref:Uncharacterized protein n=1 Tax=Nostoc flagelliforme FACHB-838 TaxID=2692904 RepID=A0ABR8E5Y3_9NOSO|nr:DUF6174 domain-containing protein [Nostoc flagelliforme]MBD2537157.1 hypothetical protein [Nostoc flagelliforme FACHB-838]
MRLPMIISAGLLLSLGLSLPVMSQSSIEIAQSPASQNLNLRRLKFNRNLWNQQNIPNYRYTFSNGCFCIPEARGPVVIEVRNGQTTSITSVATGQPVDSRYFQQYKTIPQLFNVIQDAINRKASSLSVQYAPQFGYPTQIDIDYNSQIADEEVYLRIENFEKIK